MKKKGVKRKATTIETDEPTKSKSTTKTVNKRVKRDPKPPTEHKFFAEKRSFEDLWTQIFLVGTELDQLDSVYRYKWDFSNLESALDNGGKLCNQSVYLFALTEPPRVASNEFSLVPVVVAVVSPFPPSSKIAITSVQKASEEIVPMKQMKMDWIPYMPINKRNGRGQVHILSCTLRKSALKNLDMGRINMYKFSLPYFYDPFKEDGVERNTEVQIMYPSEPTPIVCVFDLEFDVLEEFTDKLIEDKELEKDKKDEFKNFVNEKVREAKKANREAREARTKAIEEMSEETKLAFREMKFYKFYPMQIADASCKSPFISRYYGKAHEIL